MKRNCNDHGPGKCGHFGGHRTPETRAKLSAAMKAHFTIPASRPREDPVKRVALPPKPKPKSGPSVGVVTHVFPDHTYASGGEAWVLLDGATDEVYVSYARSKIELVKGDRVSVKLAELSDSGQVVQNLSRPSVSEAPTWRSGFPLRSCGRRHSFCRVCRPDAMVRSGRKKLVPTA